MSEQRDRDKGPPERERPSGYQAARPVQKSATTTDETKTTTQRRQPPLTDRWVDAGRDAALHILDQGHIPLLELEVLRALHCRGGVDRALAEMLHAATGGEIR